MSTAARPPEGVLPSLGEASRSDRRAHLSTAARPPEGVLPSLGEASRSDRRVYQ
jgi:hypothetical protein